MFKSWNQMVKATASIKVQDAGDYVWVSSVETEISGLLQGIRKKNIQYRGLERKYNIEVYEEGKVSLSL